MEIIILDGCRSKRQSLVYGQNMCIFYHTDIYVEDIMYNI
jgi:hypothetical protein